MKNMFSCDLYKDLVDVKEYNINNQTLEKLFVYTDILRIADIKIISQFHFGINNKLVKEYAFRFNGDLKVHSFWARPVEIKKSAFVIIDSLDMVTKEQAEEFALEILDNSERQTFFIMNEQLIEDFILYEDNLNKNLIIYEITEIKNDEKSVFYVAFFTKDTELRNKLAISNDVYFYDYERTLSYKPVDAKEVIDRRSFAQKYYWLVNKLKNYLDLLTNYPQVTQNLEVINKRALSLFKELFCIDNTDTLWHRKKFFSSMKKATGRVKYTQEGSCFLLKKLTDLCDKLEIKYWLYNGTLLGACRHEGFIPWDDDIDIGMMRADLHKLICYIEEDQNFCIKILYNMNWADRIYKFLFKGIDGPAYVDIFPFDYCENGNAKTWEMLKHIRSKMILDFRKKQEEFGADYLIKFDIRGEHLPELNNVFDSWHAEATKLLELREYPTDTIIYAFDTAFLSWMQVFNTKEIFPLEKKIFEGNQYFVFHNPDEILVRNYKNPYSLPSDIIAHRHTDRMDDLQKEQLYIMMEKLKDIEL